MNKKVSIITAIVFFGAFWGILEATLGYGLQFLPPLFSGSVMFPIGAMVLIYAYKHTNSRRAIFYVAIVAALIKSINLFLPGLPPIKTYNPMIAIMLQSLVMMASISLIESKQLHWKVTGFALVSVSWRVLFLANNSINHALTNFNFQHMLTMNSVWNFAIVLGLMGALILFALYLAVEFLVARFRLGFNPKPVLAWSMMLVALLLTWFI